MGKTKYVPTQLVIPGGRTHTPAQLALRLSQDNKKMQFIEIDYHTPGG
jgi:hypothetical protein